MMGVQEVPELSEHAQYLSDTNLLAMLEMGLQSVLLDRKSLIVGGASALPTITIPSRVDASAFVRVSRRNPPSSLPPGPLLHWVAAGEGVDATAGEGGDATAADGVDAT